MKTPPPLPAPSDPNLGSKLLGFFGALFIAAIGLYFLGGWLSTPTAQQSARFGERAESHAVQPYQPPATTPEPIVLRAVVLNQFEDYDAERKRTFFTGLVTNNTRETISFLTVEYSLYDESGAKIGRAVDSMQNLGPFEVWRFKAENFEKETRRFRFEGLTMH